MTDTLGVRALPGAGWWPGGQVMADPSLAVRFGCFSRCCLGVSGFLGAVGSEWELIPRVFLRAWPQGPQGERAPEPGSCRGLNCLWNSRLWEKGWPVEVFSAGALQAGRALVPSLLRREMGVGEGPPPLPGSLSPGAQDKKLDGA